MVRGCGCDRDHAMTDFEWQGCSHDLGFGAKFSRRFLQYQDENSMQSMMQAHNSKIGRKVNICLLYIPSKKIQVTLLMGRCYELNIQKFILAFRIIHFFH